MKNSKKVFSLYFILYGVFTALLIVVPFMISLIALLAKIGMTAVISFFVVISVGGYFLLAWMFLFYAANLFFFFKNQYPHKSDNLLINTFSNVIVMLVVIGINEYIALLAIFPAINLLINLNCFFRLPTTITESNS